MAKPTEADKKPHMSMKDFSDFCARQIHQRQFFEAAKEYVDALLLTSREVEKATRDRDAALAERTKVLAQIEAATREASEAQARDADRNASTFRSRQETADKALAATQAELVQVQVRLAADAAAAGEVRAELERVRAWAASETAAIQKRIAALQATETETRERLAAALRG